MMNMFINSISYSVLQIRLVFITLSPKVVYNDIKLSEVKYNGLFIQNFREGHKTQQQSNKAVMISS